MIADFKEKSVEEIREKLLSAFGENLSKYDKIGVGFDPAICLIKVPEDLQKQEDIIVLGHNQIMYSRRTLLTNYAKYHGIPNQNRLSLTTNNIHFDVVESEYGTVFYTKNIYNYFNVLNDNFKYFVLAMSFTSTIFSLNESIII